MTFNLTVEHDPDGPHLRDLNLSLTNNTAMVPSTPTLTGPGDITGWRLHPVYLPASNSVRATVRSGGHRRRF